MNAILSKLRIYPIKSLDPVNLNTVEIGYRSLKGDRNFAILGEDGRWVNGKRTGKVNELKAEFEEDLEIVHFSKRGDGYKQTFHLKKEVKPIETYLSEFFGFPVRFIENDQGRFMDIPDESSVTVVAQDTLMELARELKEDLDTLSLRFRSNIEIGMVLPFWEEHLAMPERAEGVRFKIGEVELIGISLRARCNVPPRNPWTGETDKTFIKKMIDYRSKTIPPWSKVMEYGSMYHLTVNTFIPDNQTGKILKIGDKVEII